METTRTAIVTGAAAGLGLKIAERLAAEGRRVILVDRSDVVQESAEGIKDQGGDAAALVADLMSLVDDPAALTGQLEELSGGCDILVNNAGIHPRTATGPYGFEDIEVGQWETVLRLNLTVPFLLAKWAAEGMKQRQWGRIINIASRTGQTFSAASSADYASSKAGLLGMTRQLAGELGPHKITVNAVAPGLVRSPMNIDDGSLERWTASVPARRFGTPEEVGAAVAFLASEDAGYMTGTSLNINGGAYM